SNTGILSHYHEDGQLDWSQSDLGPAGDVASNPVGSIWVLGSQSVRHYTAEGDPVWTSANLAGDYQKQLAVDNGDCTYVLGQANGSSGFVVTKLDSLGDIEWLQLHDEPAIGESGNAI